MTIIMIGIAAAIALIAIGAVAIHRRRQMALETTQFEGSKTDVNLDTGTDDEGNLGIGVGADYFKGKERRVEFYAELSTAELLDMVKEGRWDVAWPWVILNVGVFMMVVLLPLFIGALAGWPESTRCLVAVLVIAGVLFAAWPRRNRS
jgi:RsiW-degrading membrane proteinase PrsW (M82 family)